MGCVGLTAEPKKKEMRLILLGIAGSGKTTFSKQMQIIHNGGFEPSQSELYKQILMSNLIFGMKQVIEIAQESIAPENRKKARFILGTDDITSVNQEIADRIKSVWEDTAVQQAWKNRKESILIQLEYLITNLDRILAPDFVPSNDDILRARQRSTGETSYRFEDKKHVWNLVDVGGQFSERSKWGAVFENPINAILFFISLDEYDIDNVESTSDHETKFQLALTIYDEVMNGDLVREHKASRIVFLNKLDLFTSKLQSDDKFNLFKEKLEYTGENNVEKCVEFISQKLEEKIKDNMPVHIHAICGLDTSLIKKLTQDIKVSIIASSLQDMGIL